MYVYRNIEACSCSHCWCGKAMIMTQPLCVCVCVCVCVTLVFQHAMRMRHIVMWPASLYNIFPHCLINCTVFEKKLLNTKCVF